MNHLNPILRRMLLTIISGFATPLVVFADTTPEITVSPVSQTVQTGDAVMFSVTATGGNLSYQWRHGTTNLPGATINPLVLTNVGLAQAGSYSVQASNSAGTAVSGKAILTVVARELWSWGANDYDKATVPDGLGTVVAAAAGGVHSLALQADGTVAAWGLDGYFGYTTVPAGLTDVIAIAAGYYHSLALRTNGTVVGWGSTEVGQLVGTESWTNVMSIAAGANYCLGLRADGTVALGGVPYEPGSGLPTIDSGLQNVVALAARHAYCLTVRGDGTVQAWGSAQGWGSDTNVPGSLSNVVAVACGGAHSLALRSDGTVLAWGDNSLGQTNVPAGLDEVVAIACGAVHSLALRGNGAVVAWGDNSAGQTNVPVYAAPAGGVGAGCVAYHSLAVPASGSPFITTRLPDQIWNLLTPPQSVFFRVEATGARPLRYQWKRDNVDLPGATNTVLEVSDILHHQGDYSVTVSNALGVATIPPSRLRVVIPRTPMQSALDNDLPWTNGTAAAWFPQTLHTHDGVDAAQSGGITHDQESSLETSVNGPAYVSFWWKVSSEADYDVLEFQVDSVPQPGEISGEVPWQQQVHFIPEGTHTLRWRYSKDFDDTAGQDAGWLDQVNISGALATLNQPVRLSDGMLQFNFASVPGTSFTVLTTTNAALLPGSWTELGPATEVSPGQFQFTDSQTTGEVCRFYRVRSP